MGYFFKQNAVTFLMVLTYGTSLNYAQGVGKDEKQLQREMQFIRLNSFFYELSQENIRAELELTEGQSAALKKMVDEFKSLERRVMKTAGEITDREQYQADWKIAEKFAGNAKNRVWNTLLPHQRNRWNEIQWQKMTGWTTSPRGLTSGQLKDRLKLTEKQKKRINEIADELQEKEEKLKAAMKEKIEKAIAANRQKTMESLTPEQKRKYKEKVGKIIK